MSLALLLILIKSQGQTSFCLIYSSTAYPKNPQSGGSYSYGVRINLDQKFTQSLTFVGYIYDEGSPNQNNPFEITINAGSTVEQTPDNFYQTTSSGSVIVKVTTVSPSVVNSEGISYNTQCTESLIQRLNTLGQIHNDCQDYVLTYITDQNLDIEDTTNLKNVISSKTFEYLSSKGIVYSHDNTDISFGGRNTDTLKWDQSLHSSQGNTILNELKSLMLGYNEEDDQGFFAALDDLQEDAINLVDTLEAYRVGFSVTVAKYSFDYWKQNGQTWIDLFVTQDSLRNLIPAPTARVETHDYLSIITEISRGPNVSYALGPNFSFYKKCPVKLVRIGVADVSGGIRGAWGGGIVAGPGGVMAGAILGAAVGSSAAVLDQALSCLFNWW